MSRHRDESLTVVKGGNGATEKFRRRFDRNARSVLIERGFQTEAGRTTGSDVSVVGAPERERAHRDEEARVDVGGKDRTGTGPHVSRRDTTG